MTSQPLLLQNGLLAVPKERPVVVQINEVPLASPRDEWSKEATHGVLEMVGKIDPGWLDSSESMLERLNLKRPPSGGGGGGAHDLKRALRPSLRRRSSSVGSIDGNILKHGDLIRETRPSRDNPLFQRGHSAPCARHHRTFRDEKTQPMRASARRETSAVAVAPSIPLGPLKLPSWPFPSQGLAQALNRSCGVVPPLTPPEDLDTFKWDTPLQIEPSQGVRTAPNNEQSGARGQTHSQPRPSSTSRPSEIQMPEPANMAQDESSRSNWLGRACQHLGKFYAVLDFERLLTERVVSRLGDSGTQQQIQMVVQALPSQAKAADNKPVFEKVVEDIETHFTSPPYITITHAVSQVISMDEVPASPPATPNTTYSSDDYFQDQTIFTHAAVVPAYHSVTASSTTMLPRPSNIIAPPSSTQISVLERYIPPTTPQEVEDFFTLSRKSYLADRLRELSLNDGSMLLVYPTKRGAATFATRYIGPIIEPFLRRFILLNGLYMHVAIEMGRMAAVDGMKSFEEMKALLGALCEALVQRAPSRGLPSRYKIIHAETAEVVLDAAQWKEWYVEQEQPRLRQHLVDYHKAGGRMPARVGQIEVTPGMLAREVVEGIRRSREPAGNVGIEVGVFVIRRTAV